MEQSFTNLHAWKRGMDLVREIYALTSFFPREEQFGLTSQLKRAAVSIVANIAEGYGRFTYADKAAKYTIARGECSEVKAEILVAIHVGLVTDMQAQQALQFVDEVGRMISGLIHASRSRSPK